MPHPEVLALARDIVEVERAKVAAEAKAIEASDEQDKRIAEFHNRRLELDDAADRHRVALATRTMIGILAVVPVPLALVLYMVFWGTVPQREMALAILTTGGIAVAGFGVLSAVSRGVKALFNRR